MADLLQRGREITMRFASAFDCGRAGFAVGKNQKGIVCGGVAVDADGVEGSRCHFLERLLQQRRRNGRISLSSIDGSGFGYRLDEILRELPAPVLSLPSKRSEVRAV